MSDYRDNDETGQVDIMRRRLLGGSAIGAAGLALMGGMGFSSMAMAAGGMHDTQLPKHPKWKFVFINHVTTNPFFVPTQYGAADACGALGCTYQWTGSTKSKPAIMVNHMDAAIAAGVDGIAVALVDPTAFNAPVERALKKGIPVVSYNADTDGNDRLAYIGQGLYSSGLEVGKRIADSVKDGAEVVGFIATPGQLNIQPRMNGARDAIKKSGKNITLHEIATGPQVTQEFNRIESYYLGHKNIDAMFAVDAGSTEGVAKTVAKHDLHKKGVVAGGWDLLPGTLEGISKGYMDFTVDQQPYLQGFYPVVELCLWKLSGGLVGIGDIETGLKFVTKNNVGPYLTAKSRFEGSSSEEKVLKRSGPIVTV